MALEDFKSRYQSNVEGKYYVTTECMFCGICEQTAPALFKFNEDAGYSYVMKQPETKEEHESAKEALEACHTDAIFDDGDTFDWGKSDGISDPEKPTDCTGSCKCP